MLTLIACGGPAFASPAHAEYFARSDAHALRSLKSGVGVASLPVLRRKAGGAADAKLAALLDAVAQKETVAREKQGERLRAKGKTWHLDVFGDGTAAEYVDHAARSRAHASGVDRSKAMSVEALQSAGRGYIERALAKLIALGPGERLLPEATFVLMEGGVAPNGAALPTLVIANRIVFTREINDIPVVGSGSKIVITFLNDASVESFRYDWPAYEATGRVQAVASAGEVMSRLQRFMGVRTLSFQAWRVRREASRTLSVIKPVHLGGKDLRLQRLACGYYDPGYFNRDANAPIQTGCQYHVVYARANGAYVTRAGFSGAIPALRQPEPDARWPQAAALAGQKSSGPPPPPSAGPATSVQSVPPRVRQ